MAPPKVGGQIKKWGGENKNFRRHSPIIFMAPSLSETCHCPWLEVLKIEPSTREFSSRQSISHPLDHSFSKSGSICPIVLTPPLWHKNRQIWANTRYIIQIKMFAMRYFNYLLIDAGLDVFLKTEDWILKTEDWRLKAEGWSLKTEDWRLKTEDWRLKTECWRLKTEDWILKTEYWRLNAECWRRKTEYWRLKTDDWRLKADCLRLKAED